MANLFKEKGTVMVELGGMAFPFHYLSDRGVIEVVRVCMGLEPMCVAEARGSKGKKVDEDEVLAKSARTMLTPEGMEWATRNRPKRASREALIPEVAPWVFVWSSLARRCQRTQLKRESSRRGSEGA